MSLNVYEFSVEFARVRQQELRTAANTPLPTIAVTARLDRLRARLGTVLIATGHRIAGQLPAPVAPIGPA